MGFTPGEQGRPFVQVVECRKGGRIALEPGRIVGPDVDGPGVASERATGPRQDKPALRRPAEADTRDQAASVRVPKQAAVELRGGHDVIACLGCEKRAASISASRGKRKHRIARPSSSLSVATRRSPVVASLTSPQAGGETKNGTASGCRDLPSIIRLRFAGGSAVLAGHHDPRNRPLDAVAADALGKDIAFPEHALLHERARRLQYTPAASIRAALAGPS